MVAATAGVVASAPLLLIADPAVDRHIAAAAGKKMTWDIDAENFVCVGIIT
jgi:hypothetical protein